MAFWEDKRVLITGGAGFLGSHLVERLVQSGADPEKLKISRSNELDLRRWENCLKAVEGIDIVIHLAASVGGIGFNKKYPGTLFYDNIMMGVQVMEAARVIGVEKFVAIGTVCAYPKFTPVPFKEDSLWDGYPEETNAPYGIAKKALLVQAQAYREQYGFNAIFLLPVNLYGPGDNFDLENSHVIPALIRKCVEAADKKQEEIVVWGTGKPSREFLYVEDCVEAIVLAAEKYNKPEPVNIGSGNEIKIRDLVHLIADLTGFGGRLAWDNSRPDGQPRRCLDTSRAEREFGFRARTNLKTGLNKTITWYKGIYGLKQKA